MSMETPKQRAELVNKLVDEASMVNTLRSEIKSLNEQLYESKSDCEQLAIRLANRACVPAEPTEAMLEAGLRATDSFAEPSDNVIENGVVVEYGLTQADCDGINAECMVGCAAQYKAMLSAAPVPAGERVSVPIRAIEYAIEQLSHYTVMLDPECTCEDCPQCGKAPKECTGTPCAQTCQCNECDHCHSTMAIDGLKAMLSAQPTAEPAQGEMCDATVYCFCKTKAIALSTEAINAGVGVLMGWENDYQTPNQIVIEIFQTMSEVSPK